MKLLLDQGLPRSTTALLRAAGHDAVHVGEVGLSRVEDPGILEYARREARVIVTLDADFHARLALSGAASPSVIRVRVEGLRAEPLATLLEQVIGQCSHDLADGAVVSVLATRIRLRRLPITKPGR